MGRGSCRQCGEKREYDSQIFCAGCGHAFPKKEASTNSTCSPSSMLALYSTALRRGGWLVILLWMGIMGLGVWQGFRIFDLSSSGNSQFSSPGVTAQKHLGLMFPALEMTEVSAVMMVRMDDQAIDPTNTTDPTAVFTTELVRQVWAQMPPTNEWPLPYVLMMESPFVTSIVNLTDLAAYAGDDDAFTGFGPPINFTTPDPHKFMSSDSKMALIVFREVSEQDDIGQPKLDQIIQSVSKRHLDVLVQVTGSPEIWSTSGDEMEHDLELGDGLSIPSALILLCFALRSPRYFFLPIISIAGSTLLAFTVMVPIALHSAVSNVAPNLIMVLSIALAVDYNLFMVSRWREETVDGLDHNDAVQASIATAGHTILVSGFTLICCCFGLLMVPVDVIQSLGTAAAVVVTCAMLVSLTLTPALLFSFPRYFKNGIKEEDWFRCKKVVKPIPSAALRKRRAGSRARDYEPASPTIAESMQLLDPADYATGSVNNASAGRDVARQSRRLKKGGWFRLGEFVTKSWRPYFIVACVVALCGYVAYPASEFGKVGGIICFAAVNNPWFHVFNNVFTPNFGAGRLFPYQLILEVNGSYADQLPLLVNVTQSALEGVHPQLVEISSFQSHIVTVGNGSAYPPLDGGCSNLQNPLEVELCTGVYEGWWNANYVSGQPTMTILEFGLSVDQWGSGGVKWLPAARDRLNDVEVQFSAFGAKAYLAAGAAVDLDLINLVYATFWHTIAYVAAVVFVLMTFIFRSAVVSLKAVVSIGMTLSITYGFTRFVYEKGAFDNLNFRGTASTGGLCWIPPVLTFPMLIGFGLDYHIFLLSRVVEFRMRRFTDHESVLYGLSKTGRIITFAGVIMAVAFLGLLPSHEGTLQQISFIISVAVMCDTFLIRAIMIPCMMSILGKWNWWPRKMPPPLQRQGSLHRTGAALITDTYEDD
eukprot:m.460557 g.460557  ORF g.460557 m.460557 type:complete len:931 (-) comp22067_c0_seq1:178-2970(-)